MGSLSALGMAEAVSEGYGSLDTALSWHLTSNHYPPLPTFFIPTCKAAIEAGDDEDWNRDIPLPRFCVTHQVDVEVEATRCAKNDGCRIEAAVTWRDDRDVVRAGDLIESFHLDSFLGVVPGLTDGED